jgi:hypothetical protein
LACLKNLPRRPGAASAGARECPNDRKLFELPAIGVDGLPKNYALLDVLQSAKEKAAAGEGGMWRQAEPELAAYRETPEAKRLVAEVLFSCAVNLRKIITKAASLQMPPP